MAHYAYECESNTYCESIFYECKYNLDDPIENIRITKDDIQGNPLYKIKSKFGDIYLELDSLVP